MEASDIPKRRLLICPLVAWIINDQLKKKLQPSKNLYSSDKTKIEWKSQGKPKTTNPVNCGSHHLITCKHMFYALSGGYGFESTLSNERLIMLYKHGFGTDDLDFKIYFDVRAMKTTYGKTIDKEWFIDFRNDVLRELTTRRLVSTTGIKKITVKEQGFGFATNVVDLFLGDISSCQALTYFMGIRQPPTGEIKLDFTGKFAIFSTIHMFMICHAIKVGGVALCRNEANRVTKFPKILFRAMLLTDLAYTDVWEKIKNDESSLKIQSSLVWLHMTQNPSYQYREYVDAILRMTGFPRTFPEKRSDESFDVIPGQVVGGDDGVSDDSRPECLLLDASTMFDLFGAESGDSNNVEYDEGHIIDAGNDDVTQNINSDPDIPDYDPSLDDEPAVDQTLLHDGGSGSRSGKAAAIFGCVGALVFATVAGSVRR